MLAAGRIQGVCGGGFCGFCMGSVVVMGILHSVSVLLAV